MNSINKELKIKLYDGPGICKADNVYRGIDKASGDIIVIYDAANDVGFGGGDALFSAVASTALSNA